MQQKKTFRRIIPIAAAAFAVLLLCIGGWLLLRQHGEEAYIGTEAMEKVKLHAKLTGAPAENALRMHDYPYCTESPEYQQIAYTGDGCYTYGNPTQEDRYPGLCYTDFASGETVYLCAKAECLHDGSDFCVATNTAYELQKFVCYEDRLYAVALHRSGDAVQTVLLEYQPDGTEMQEIAVLSENGSAPFCEIFAHCGALWIGMTVETLLGKDSNPLDGEITIREAGYVLYHYEIAKKKLTAILQSSESYNSTTTVFADFQADGDMVYFQLRDSDIGGLEKGLYQINARSGVIRQMPQSASMMENGYTAANGKLCYIEKAAQPIENGVKVYALHILDPESGEETVCSVPRGSELFTDGTYFFIASGQKRLTALDPDGKPVAEMALTRESHETSVQNDTGAYSDAYQFAYADGMLWVVRTEFYGYRLTDLIRYYERISVADFLAGKTETEPLFTAHHVTDRFEDAAARIWS